jgi:hypothetical protein
LVVLLVLLGLIPGMCFALHLQAVASKEGAAAAVTTPTLNAGTR